MRGYYAETFYVDGDPISCWILLEVIEAHTACAPRAGGPHDAEFEVPTSVELKSVHFLDGHTCPVVDWGDADLLRGEILAAYEAGTLELLDTPRCI